MKCVTSKPKEVTKDNGSKRKIPNAAKAEALTLSGGWANGVCLQASAIFVINTVHATQFIDPEGSDASEVNPEMVEHPIQSVSNNRNGNQAIHGIHIDFFKLLKADTTSLSLRSLPLGLAWRRDLLSLL